jgi:pentatricopeptide repeat protein
MQLMQRDGVQANSFTYTAAIKACSRAGQWQAALALLDSAVAEHAAAETAAAAAAAAAAEAAALLPPPVTEVVVGAEEQEQEETVPELFPVSRPKPPTPIVDVAVYNAAIQACGGQAQQLEAGVFHMASHCCTTFQRFMSAYSVQLS